MKKTQQEIQDELNSLAKWMELPDTVPYMVGSGYRNRMRAEALQLAIRIRKLLEALKKYDDPLLIRQLALMKEYYEVLTERMAKDQ